jgi:hypothetical protein
MPNVDYNEAVAIFELDENSSFHSFTEGLNQVAKEKGNKKILFMGMSEPKDKELKKVFIVFVP